MSNETKPKDYRQIPELVKAVGVFLDLRSYMLDKYGDIELSINHLAACLLEDYLNRRFPLDSRGDLMIEAARVLAPGLVDEIENELRLNELFSIQGNNEVH